MYTHKLYVSKTIQKDYTTYTKYLRLHNGRCFFCVSELIEIYSNETFN